MSGNDFGLEYLLDLDGEAFSISEKHFVSFKAQRIIAWAEIPHGIKYALILFDKDKNRVICFDNAHGIKTHRQIEWDHLHKREKVVHYVFESTSKLLEDF